MVSLYVGITDYEWFRFLSASPSIEEVNFWQPGGRTNFRAVRAGELFLFKLHAPRNFIVGGGVFARAEILPTSIAWDAFGQSNGAVSLSEMRERIARYREQANDPRQDYMIGCRILTQPFFLSRPRMDSGPESWSPHIQQGRTYDTAEADGRRLWELIMDRVATRPDAPIAVPRYGEPVLIRPRLGQGAFRIGVTGVYQRRCAVTGERTLPILDAATSAHTARAATTKSQMGCCCELMSTGFLISATLQSAATDVLKSGDASKKILRTGVTTTRCMGSRSPCPTTLR